MTNWKVVTIIVTIINFIRSRSFSHRVGPFFFSFLLQSYSTVEFEEKSGSTLSVGTLSFSDYCFVSMDSDSIERLQRVSLTAEEDVVIMVRSKHRKKTLEDWSLCLLGMFHTTKLIDFRAAKNHLLSAWKMGGNGVKITDFGDGLFRFNFSMEGQLKWVINNGPWSFDNHILLLRRWEKGMTAFSVNFQTVPMWVQVWGLPFDLINKEVGIDIGQGIGRVIEVDWKAIASDQARFLRVRVDVPLDKPIRRGAPVLSPEGDKVRVAFQYERLCGLCFHCGLLGHEAKACKTTKLKVGEESPYGKWLRATEDVVEDGNPNGHGIDGAEF